MKPAAPASPRDAERTSSFPSMTGSSFAEGAEAARATSSGMAAVFAALASLVKSGDRVVASDALFGSSTVLAKLHQRRVAAVPAATVAAAIGVGNAGFEAPTLNDGTSTLDPPATGLRWQYGTDAGVATNGSGFFTNNAPQGRQAALVRNNNKVVVAAATNLKKARGSRKGTKERNLRLGKCSKS